MNPSREREKEGLEEPRSVGCPAPREWFGWRSVDPTGNTEIGVTGRDPNRRTYAVTLGVLLRPYPVSVMTVPNFRKFCLWVRLEEL